jgi:hypothetical protein
MIIDWDLALIYEQHQKHNVIESLVKTEFKLPGIVFYTAVGLYNGYKHGSNKKTTMPATRLGVNYTLRYNTFCINLEGFYRSSGREFWGIVSWGNNIQVGLWGSYIMPAVKVKEKIYTLKTTLWGLYGALKYKRIKLEAFYSPVYKTIKRDNYTFKIHQPLTLTVSISF